MSEVLKKYEAMCGGRNLVALDFEFTSHPDSDQEMAGNWFSEIVGLF